MLFFQQDNSYHYNVCSDADDLTNIVCLCINIGQLITSCGTLFYITKKQNNRSREILFMMTCIIVGYVMNTIATVLIMSLCNHPFNVNESQAVLVLWGISVLLFTTVSWIICTKLFKAFESMSEILRGGNMDRKQKWKIITGIGIGVVVFTTVYRFALLYSAEDTVNHGHYNRLIRQYKTITLIFCVIAMVGAILLLLVKVRVHKLISNNKRLQERTRAQYILNVIILLAILAMCIARLVLLRDAITQNWRFIRSILNLIMFDMIMLLLVKYGKTNLISISRNSDGQLQIQIKAKDRNQEPLFGRKKDKAPEPPVPTHEK